MFGLTPLGTFHTAISLIALAAGFVAGKTVGGTPLYGEENRLDRMEALRLWTVGSAWFSNEQGKKGALVPGQLADLAVLSADYFSIPEDEIKHLESVLTFVGGDVVHAGAEFSPRAPAALPVMPAWSPVAKFGGYAAPLSMSGCECAIF